jgi:hypothetical protein
MKRRIVLGATLFILIGCNTVRITERPPIIVPPGLTAAQVEQAIMYSVFGAQPGTSPTALRPAVSAYPEPAYLQVRRSEWNFEGAEPGVIMGSVSPRTHYLRVKIQYDAHRVEVMIDGAKHMKYTGSRIHGKAIQWIANLERTIRGGLNLAAISR